MSLGSLAGPISSCMISDADGVAARDFVQAMPGSQGGVSYPASLASFFTERFLDVMVVAMLASLTVVAFDEYIGFVLIATVIILLMLPLIRSQLFISILTSLHKRFHRQKIKTAFEHLITLIRSAHLVPPHQSAGGRHRSFTIFRVAALPVVSRRTK